MASKKEIDNQKELNALQRLTMSYMKDMEKSAADLASSTDKRNKSLDKELSITQKNLKALQRTGDISKLIARVNTQIGQSQSKNFGVNEKNRTAYLAQLDAIKGVATAQKNAAIAAQGVFDVTDEVASNFNSILNGIDGFIKKIPIIGPALSNAFKPIKEKGELAISRATDGMKNGFIRQFTRAKDAGLSFTDSFSKGMSGGLKGAQSALAGTLGISTALIVPLLAVVAIGYLIYKAFQLGLERFKELDSAAQSFRDNTGLLVSQTRGMQENIRAVNVEFANLGVSAQDVAKAASEFVNEFDGLEQPSQAVLGSMVTLNKNFGVGTQEAAKLNKVFQNIGNLSAEQSQYLIGQTAEMAKMAGVAPQRVIKDMADSSEYAYKYFKGSPEELAKAAVQAAKLGTSIKEAGKVADNLLDFQNSISKELEASAMLGVNINLGQARYLAANGKILESQQAVVDQVAGLGDLTKLNVYEQEALVAATGMEFDSLVNQQRIRERFGKLNEEQLAAATSLLDTGKDINDINQKDLELQSQKLKSQQDMQSTMTAIQNETGALKTGFMDMLAPLAGFAMNVLLEGLKQIGMVLNPIMKGIGAIARVIFGVFGMVFDLVSAILSPIVAIGGAIIDMLVTPFQALATKMQPLFDRFKELKEATMKAVQPILDVFRSLGNMMGEMVGSGPIGMFIDFLTWGLGKIVSIIGGIAKGIAFVLKPIMTLIGYLMEGISFIGKMINDYIIQPALAAGQMVGNVLSKLTFGLIGGDDSEGASTGGTQGGSSQVQDIPLMADGGIVQSPIQAVVGEAGPEAIIPLDQLASVLGGVSAPTNERPSWVDEVVSAIRENKDVYMDKVKVSSTVTDTQERNGRQNRFGLQGA